MVTTLALRSIERCRAGQNRLDTSRRLLAQSRRLLNRAWWIAGASDAHSDLGTKGVIHIMRENHSDDTSRPSTFLISFGGKKDGIGVFYLGRASGLDPLVALLQIVGASPAEVDTALHALAERPQHEIANVVLTQGTIRELGL